jgi:hypothetical protein
VNTIIYNDGIPSCSFQGTQCEFLHGIADDTLDEAYPPSAEDAAELEAVEIFVEMMATLAYLEDKEEALRSSEHLGLQKRWAARRELVGRPRPAMHSIEPSLHGTTGSAKKNEKVTDIVSIQLITQQDRAMRLREQEMARAMMGKSAATGGKHMNLKGTNHSAHKTIQQPRKHC